MVRSCFLTVTIVLCVGCAPKIDVAPKECAPLDRISILGAHFGTIAVRSEHVGTVDHSSTQFEIFAPYPKSALPEKVNVSISNTWGTATTSVTLQGAFPDKPAPKISAVTQEPSSSYYVLKLTVTNAYPYSGKSAPQTTNWDGDNPYFAGPAVFAIDDNNRRTEARSTVFNPTDRNVLYAIFLRSSNTGQPVLKPGMYSVQLQNSEAFGGGISNIVTGVEVR